MKRRSFLATVFVSLIVLIFPKKIQSNEIIYTQSKLDIDSIMNLFRKHLAKFQGVKKKAVDREYYWIDATPEMLIMHAKKFFQDIQTVYDISYKITDCKIEFCKEKIDRWGDLSHHYIISGHINDHNFSEIVPDNQTKSFDSLPIVLSIKYGEAKRSSPIQK